MKPQFLRIFFLLIFLTGSKYGLTQEIHGKKVDVEWEAIQGAKEYDLEFTPPSGSPLTFKSTSHQWSGSMMPGIYKMRIRAIDARGKPSEWSDPENFKVALDAPQVVSPAKDAQVKSGELDDANITFSWQPVVGATSYSVNVWDEHEEFKLPLTSKEPAVTAKVPIGKFLFWKVTANAEGLAPTQTENVKFIVLGRKLDSPKIKPLSSQFVREISWTTPEFAEKFSYRLWHRNPKTKKWDTVDSKNEVSENSLSFSPHWPGGVYSIRVAAKGKMRGDSDWAEMNFLVKDGDRSTSIEESSKLMGAIDRVVGWYGVASYYITIMNYVGTNWDYNSSSSFNGLGGTGRLGMGWNNSVSPWGFYGFAELSGISLESYGNFLFYSLEGDAVYRKHLTSRGEVRHQFGWFIQQMPELISDNSHGQSGAVRTTSTISQMGPHYGIEYWYAFTPVIGMQANAHIYPSFLALKTPNGSPLVPTLSEQVGILGSYRLQKNVTGLIGYAYRNNQAKYKANSNLIASGQTNSSSLSGHYLNLLLEWSL